MSFRDLPLKVSYETGIDDLIEDFYIPVLECAHRYDRIAGFFSSTALALAARGLSGFINNGGKMRLLTCPRLSKGDIDSINQALTDPNKIIEKSMISQLSVEDEFQRDHIAALGWLLATGKLEMKIAVMYNNGKLMTPEEIAESIMHQKVGILFDDKFDSISFSGSNNESANGWLENIEEFKVFRAWEPGQFAFYKSDCDRFDRLWNGNHPLAKTVNLPDAVKSKLIEQGSGFHSDRIAPSQYKSHRSKVVIHEKKRDELQLFDYQGEAVQMWQTNHFSLLMEMATGCGKTRTAIGCIRSVQEKHITPLLVIISCPGNTLSMQWKSDIDSLNVDVNQSMVCDGTNPQWKKELNKVLLKMSAGMQDNLFIYTTHDTCSSDDFISIIEKCSRKIHILFIGDEVHGLGAQKARRGLLVKYEYRIGLSATPSRWFDDTGTKIVADFFGNKSFVFTIKDALQTINQKTGKPFLVNYYYHPRFISLTNTEMEDYRKISERISRMHHSNDEEKEKILEYMLFQRANIEKSADNKYDELDSILDEIGDDKIEDTIIFVSPEQIDRVLAILDRRNIPSHRFSEKESNTPSEKYNNLSERQHLIQLFKSKKLKVLVAIKCLDEGIDIPSARRAIVMASSTNPREYIQRVGRVIRQSEDKKFAEIYDMIIRPNTSAGFSKEFKELEKRIFSKELVRVTELSENALNNVSVLRVIKKIEGELK